MAAVYAGSHLTIATTGAQDSRSSLFVDRTEATAQVSYSYGDGTNLDLYLRKAIPHDQFWQENTTFVKDPKDDPEFPLLSRGRVYQERVLSPRIPHFTRYELVWECMQKVNCECRQDRYAYDLHKKDMSEALGATDWSPGRVNWAWHRAIERYIIKNLTFEKDRLPALSGLAKTFCQMKPSAGYLAGLWKDNLALDLLWYVPQTAAMKTVQRRLPTWSWASLVEKIWCYHCNGTSKAVQIDILHAGVELTGPDPTGEVGSGEIILKGKVEQVKRLTAYNPNNGVQLIIKPFEPEPDERTGYKITFDGERNEEHRVTVYWDNDESYNKGIHLLKVSENEHKLCFLVLRSSDEVHHDRFSRVGMGFWKQDHRNISPRPFARSTVKRIYLM